MSTRKSTRPKFKTARANRLTTAPKIRPLDPDKPLAASRVPALKAFDRKMPRQLTLEDMGVIEAPGEPSA
jgi:hypothetical protein